MHLRQASIALAALLLCSPAPAVLAQEEEVYQRIEDLHGDADGFFELFSLLQDAMMFGDPVTVAQYAIYPLRVTADGEAYEILDEETLLADFDTLVWPETQDALRNQDVADLFVNQDGVSIGDGTIWITNICLDDSCDETQWGILSINN